MKFISRARLVVYCLVGCVIGGASVFATTWLVTPAVDSGTDYVLEVSDTPPPSVTVDLVPISFEDAIPPAVKQALSSAKSEFVAEPHPTERTSVYTPLVGQGVLMPYATFLHVLEAKPSPTSSDAYTVTVGVTCELLSGGTPTMCLAPIEEIWTFNSTSGDLSFISRTPPAATAWVQ